MRTSCVGLEIKACNLALKISWNTRVSVKVVKHLIKCIVVFGSSGALL